MLRSRLFHVCRLSLSCPFNRVVHPTLRPLVFSQVRESSGKVRERSRTSPAQKFRDYLTEQKIHDAATIYNSYSSPADLAHPDLERYILLLRRIWRSKSSRGDTRLVNIAKAVTNDIYQRNVQRISSSLINNLLAFYRESNLCEDGRKLWEWIRREEKHVVNASTCYDAILLLTRLGESLDVIEKIYDEAVALLAGPFTSYHLTPNAILKDRNSMLPPKVVPSASRNLLMAIARARLNHGHWKDAYLTLDTALRLYPAPHLGMLPDFVRGRPPAEAYCLLWLGWQRKTVWHPRDVSKMIEVLDEKLSLSMPNGEFLEMSLVAFESTLYLLLAQFDSKGQLADSHLHRLLRFLSDILTKAQLRDGTGSMSEYAKKISLIAEELLRSFLPLLPDPGFSSQMMLMSIALKAYNRDLFQRTYAGFADSGGTLASYIARQLVLASGTWEDLAEVQYHWSKLKDLSGDVSLTADDWQALARAVRNLGSPADAVKFLGDEMSKSNLTDSDVDKYMLATKVRPIKDALDLSGAHTGLLDIMDHTKDAREQLREVSSEPQIDYFEGAPTMRSMRLGSREELWRIYNEVSVDPDAGDAVSNQQITFEQLKDYPGIKMRFGAWVTITELMSSAEESDSRQRRPEFGTFEELRDYVLRLRGIPH